jgi:hypothetical protein
MTPPSRFVLFYHCVTYVDHDPFGFVVEANRFLEQCRILRRRFDVVPLSGDSRGERQVVITFDETYRQFETRNLWPGGG